MVRKLWPGYIALYKSKGGQTLTVKTLDPPPEVRKFKVTGGVRKFKRVKYKKHLQEVLIVAKATKTKKKGKDKEVTDDELEELESVDDLDEDDDLEDEVEDDEDEDEEEDEEEPDDEDDDDEDEDDDEEEDEDDEPAPKKSKKKKARQSQASKNGKVGTAEVAEYCGVDARTLRMVLREKNIAKDEETGRYEWPSLKSKEVVKIKKLVDGGAADKIKKASLDRLKEKKAAEKEAKESTGKKKGKKKKHKKSE